MTIVLSSMYYGLRVTCVISTACIGVHRKPLYALGAPLSQGDSDVVNKLLKSVEIVSRFLFLLDGSKSSQRICFSNVQAWNGKTWTRTGWTGIQMPKIESNFSQAIRRCPYCWGTFRLTNGSNKGWILINYFQEKRWPVIWHDFVNGRSFQI